MLSTMLSKRYKGIGREMGRYARSRGIIGDEKGQVGQESNLQPAVLESAAVRSGTLREVHEAAQNGPN